MAYCLAVRPAGGDRTWTVVDASYATVGPVEEWLEAHRHLWSPNTVRGYATSLAQWWSFLEQRGEGGQWADAGGPAVSGFLSWLRNGRTVEAAGMARRPDAEGRFESSDQEECSFFSPVTLTPLSVCGRAGSAAARSCDRLLPPVPKVKPGPVMPFAAGRPGHRYRRLRTRVA